MVRVVELARKAANTPVTILLLGESGTGKELFAHAIHNSSRRRHNQFIRVNCAAIPDSLLESELFGYSEGAFTGARRGGKKGLFEQASGGTIFLDEIGEVSLNVQAKLLRVLQERRLSGWGCQAHPRGCAHHCRHQHRPGKGRGRRQVPRGPVLQDSGISPTSAAAGRREEIPALAGICCASLTRNTAGWWRTYQEAIALLQEYSWPGNVRELETYWAGR